MFSIPLWARGGFSFAYYGRPIEKVKEGISWSGMRTVLNKYCLNSILQNIYWKRGRSENWNNGILEKWNDGRIEKLQDMKQGGYRL
jgi:hypothetical protein